MAAGRRRNHVSGVVCAAEAGGHLSEAGFEASPELHLHVPGVATHGAEEREPGCGAQPQGKIGHLLGAIQVLDAASHLP